MFEVGFTEILLICAIALLVVGPARLPKLAADVGRWAGRARSMARQLPDSLSTEAARIRAAGLAHQHAADSRIGRCRIQAVGRQL